MTLFAGLLVLHFQVRVRPERLQLDFTSDSSTIPSDLSKHILMLHL